MRDPVYTYCREVLPPSVVERAAGLCFTRDSASNLVLARGNVLEVYEAELVMKRAAGDDSEVPGDEYMFRDSHAEEFALPMIRDDAKGRGGAAAADGEAGGAKRPQLRLVGRWSLHGKIMGVQPVRRGKGQPGLDRLLLSFAEAKMSLVSFDPSTQGIVTESIHYYEHESLKKRTFNDNQTCDLRADPEYRCVALRLYDDQLAVLPFAAPGGLAGADAAKPYADSFVINMRGGDVDVRNIRDFVFLSGYLEPTLALLHEQAPSWAGQLENARDTCSVTVVSLDMARKSVSVINSASRLPYDCQTLLPIPVPIGGVIVLATSSIAHVANGTISCISALNKTATHGIGAAMEAYLDMTNVDLELTLNPLASVCAIVGTNTVALWTQHGRVFLLQLAGNGRLVKRIVARRIAGTDVRGEVQAPVAHTWDDIAILPSCVAELRLSHDDEGDGAADERLFFVGGNSGRSLLLGIRDAGPASGTAGAAEPGLPPDSGADIDADLYGDAVPRPAAVATAAGAADADADVPLTMGQTGVVSSNQDDSSASWADGYRVTVYDELLGTGAVAAMDIGVSATAGALGHHGPEPLELVTCMGNEWRGGLCVQQRHIQPEVIASFELPGAPVRGIWTARCLKEYNIGGVMQAADKASLADLSDTFMVLSRDASTSVFVAGSELQELDRTGFFTGGPTICVGEILGHTRVVQVHMQGLRVVNASGRETQSIEFGQSHHAVFAEVADPYVLVRARTGEISIFEASSQSGRLQELPVGGLAKGRQVAAASLFEDAHRVFSTNKEWVERNSEALGSQAHAADGGALLGEAFDSLYADAPAPRKRKRARNHAAPGRGKRDGGDTLDDLYDEDTSERPDDDGSALQGADRAALGRQPDEDARSEEVGGRCPVYLILVLTNGDLNIMRLPQIDRVWATLRFDYLLDTLTAATSHGSLRVAAPPGESGESSGSDSDGSSDDGGGAAQGQGLGQSTARGLRAGNGGSGGLASPTDAGTAAGRRFGEPAPIAAQRGRRISQLRLVQLGCDSIAGTHLVVLTTAGELAVYRAYEHCAKEYLARRLVAQSEGGDLAVRDDEVLAVRFARMQHDVLAYDPDYERKVRQVQSRHAQAFKAWDKRNKLRVAEQLRAEKLARMRAQETRRHEEAMAVADWSDGSDNEMPGVEAGAGAAPGEAAGSAMQESASDDGDADADADVDVDAEADADDDADDDGMYPLESTCKFTTLDNVGGYPALFVSGHRPVLVIVGPKRYARVHPLRLPSRLPPTLQPAGAAMDFDAEASGLATPCRPVVGMARFHSPACAHGMVALTQAGAVVVAALQTPAQTARGGIEFDAPWPVRCLPVGTARSGVSTQGGIAFHASSGCYAVAATTVGPFLIREPNPDMADQQAREAAREGKRAEPAPGRVIPEFQRAGLATTSAPPLVPRFAIDLLSPVTWETIDSHQLEPDEHIAAMRVAQLDSAQAPGGSRLLLCVGTGFVLGEDVLSRGRIYVFDIVDVVPLPGRPQTSRRLKLLYQEDVHGAVSALGELRGSLVMSVGSKIFVRSFNDAALVSFAFLDCQSWVRSLCGLRNYLMIGDLVSSVWLAGFQEEGPTRLQVLGRDPAPLPVECVDAVVLGRQMQVLAADAHGHLHFLVYAPREAHSSGGQRLLRRGEYSLGSRAVAVRRLAAPREGVPRQVCLVATASGAVHAVTMLPEKSFKRLHRIAAQLVRGVPPLAGLNPREYRAVPGHHRNHHAPRRTVLDGDLLAPLYAHGPASRQREAAQRDGTSPDRVLRDIVDTESAFSLL